MTEPNKDHPQNENTPQENQAIETQAMNPVTTNEKGEVVGDSKTVGEDTNEKSEDSK